MEPFQRIGQDRCIRGQPNYFNAKLAPRFAQLLGGWSGEVATNQPRGPLARSSGRTVARAHFSAKEAGADEPACLSCQRPVSELSASGMLRRLSYLSDAELV
jgi:hypothetical protein